MIVTSRSSLTKFPADPPAIQASFDTCSSDSCNAPGSFRAHISAVDSNLRHKIKITTLDEQVPLEI